MTSILHSALFIGSLLVYEAACQQRPTSTITTTIPWTGTVVTSTTITPCTGPATIYIETPIETTTCPPAPTPIRPVPCEALPDCSAYGLNIDYYANPIGGYGAGTVPASYYITEGLSPLDSSFTNTTFFPQDMPPADTTGWTRDTNGGVIVNANNFTLVYYGFYVPPSTGIFTICTSADNENDVFLGKGNAYSCDTGKPSADAQPLQVTTGGSYVNPINCTDVYLYEGLYYPIRSVMGNYGGPSAFNLTIWEPDVPFEDREHDFTGSVYPLSCAWLAGVKVNGIARGD
ncbi:hypothetical protein F4678DRAFT_254271 [Xylaria arbuscula]|nr:hypothetical protein F4678DRAFT_254271 [Xylaria arbuscula]